MKLQQILSLTRQAVDDYSMIADKDNIAVGLSGGKDSIALLYALKELQRFYPNTFSLMAITVDLGFGNFQLDQMIQYCRELSVPLEIISTHISDIVFKERKEKNPCSLCAKLRKGALNQAALSHGCNTIAYAHHKDDFIETMLMSMIYEGRYYSFPPKLHLDDTGLKVIRPFLYVNEADIVGFKNRYDLPVLKNPCPADGRTKREYIKELVHRINLENPGAKKSLFSALKNSSIWDQ